MNETAMWVIGQFLFLMGGLVVIYASLAQRITRLETFFEVFGKKAAQILHSPHTPQLDAYLEKYLSNTMTDSDWNALLLLVEEIENDQSRPREERGLCAIISVHCRKRLGLPMPGMRRLANDSTT